MSTANNKNSNVLDMFKLLESHHIFPHNMDAPRIYDPLRIAKTGLHIVLIPNGPWSKYTTMACLYRTGQNSVTHKEITTMPLSTLLNLDRETLIDIREQFDKYQAEIVDARAKLYHLEQNLAKKFRDKVTKQIS